VDPETRTSKPDLVLLRFSFVRKPQRYSEHKIANYFHLLSRGSCEKRSLYESFVQLIRHRFVIHRYITAPKGVGEDRYMGGTVRIASDIFWTCLAFNVDKNKNKNVKRKRTRSLSLLCFSVKYTNVNKRSPDYLTLRSDTQWKVSKKDIKF
jgi:hypothetical protein